MKNLHMQKNSLQHLTQTGLTDNLQKLRTVRDSLRIRNFLKSGNVKLI